MLKFYSTEMNLKIASTLQLLNPVYISNAKQPNRHSAILSLFYACEFGNRTGECQNRFNIFHFHRKTVSHSGEKRENLLYRARRINEKNNKEIVYDLTFSLPKSRASECKLILKHNGTPKLNINDLSNIPNAKADIKEALADTTGAGSGKLHIKSETPDFYLYRFYGYLEADSNDSIDVTLIFPWIKDSVEYYRTTQKELYGKTPSYIINKNLKNK